MPLFSAFTPFGQYAFSSKKPVAQTFYDSLLAGEGGNFAEDINSKQGARRYAAAMCLASAKFQFDRAENNRNPAKATELLPALERDYQVTPRYGSSLEERRSVLSARAKVTRGARRESVEDALRTLLGDDFVSYEPLPAQSFPAGYESMATFAARGAQRKIFRILEPISLLGSPRSVLFETLGGSDAPIPGETYTVEPDPCGKPEAVIVAAVNGSTLTATFWRVHEPGTVAVRPCPLWGSMRRYNVVTLKAAAAQDQETRRKVNDLMSRILRGVSQWCIVSDSGTFQLDTPGRDVLGSTRLK